MRGKALKMTSEYCKGTLFGGEIMNYVYIVRCSDGTLYTGWTNNLELRIQAHNEGRGAKYTRARRPVELVYSETAPSKSEAMKRECEIKRLSRREKHELIEGDQDAD